MKKLSIMSANRLFVDDRRLSDLGLSYKSAFVLLHKLREAMSEEMKGRVVGGDPKAATAPDCLIGSKKRLQPGGSWSRTWDVPVGRSPAQP
jgi:hypothetical protein